MPHRPTHNKQLQRTVIRRRGDGASAPFHYALAPRFTRQRAAAELRRYTARTAYRNGRVDVRFRPIRDSGCNHDERPSILVLFRAGAVQEAMMKMPMVMAVVSALLLAFVVPLLAQQATAWRDTSSHERSFIPVSHDVRLE